MAEAEAALQKLAAAIKQAGTTPKVSSLQLLGELGLDVAPGELEADIVADVANVIAVANGEAGDRVKYKAAVAQMARRWEIFLAVHGIELEQQPTDEMVQSFCGFMYRYRQRASKAGRQGLGDSMAEMAQYILAQVCTSPGGGSSGGSSSSSSMSSSSSSSMSSSMRAAAAVRRRLVQ